MKALVIYDSAYGNTERVAQAIAAALGSPAAVTTLRVTDVTPAQLTGLDMLVVGSPTQRMRPTEAVANLLRAIPRDALKAVKVAAFDTRIAQSEIDKHRVLAFFVRLFGFAAEKIAAKLKQKGGDLVAPPEGFIVDGTEGPLHVGELERATEWARRIAALATLPTSSAACA